MRGRGLGRGQFLYKGSVVRVSASYSSHLTVIPVDSVPAAGIGLVCYILPGYTVRLAMLTSARSSVPYDKVILKRDIHY